ncbi:2Fe-2S iron-sulfur cluster-binding protein [Chelatococcus reniformis]|uniref:Ferredoxin n=1 Tax=Chelatococcus reniformis TaxID=1494448 RepID=A0A916TWP9_9HYPH|nr:2Fe-2S iron-sulfur cluster-binding protein [Chelatococcus reniformis]GGC47079.1 ferredoxin [Chelatococcus reniformis]
MPQVIFVHPDGRQDAIEIAVGASVMQGATQHGIEEILAECGGNAMCATCHVYVDDEQIGRLVPMSENEDALLDGTAAERQPTSRLACQIEVTPALDGLLVRLPDRQT